MTSKEAKEYNIIYSIYDELFGLNGSHKQDFNFDVSYGTSHFLDLTQTSGNLDFKVSTYQSRGENVYFNISLYDYEKKTETDAGYFYIKNYTGEIGSEELKALALIMQAGNERTNEIYKAIA